MAAASPLARVTLDVPPGVTTALLDAERAQAVADLQAEALFRPAAAIFAAIPPGALLSLRLSLADRHLVFEVRDGEDSRSFGTVALALGPFRAAIKDYKLLVDSHVAALAAGGQARIQAIDMGRRGLHDEAASLVRARLAGKIDIDLPTARRLFTLLCVLHRRDGDSALAQALPPP